MWWKSSSILISFVVITISGNFTLADCPSADLTGDCFVDFEDFAEMAGQWLNGYDWNDVNTLASQWLTTDPCVPDDMVYIPDGEFEMGDHTLPPEGGSDELPVHTVLLDAFFMSRYEITNGQYCQFLNSALGNNSIYVSNGTVYANGGGWGYCDTSTIHNGSRIEYSDANGNFFVRIIGGRDMSDDPMVIVSWYGAAAYCDWRSQQEGKDQCYSSGWCDFTKNGYRLATEAEWEYAARGGEHFPYFRYPWGDSIDGSQANYGSSGDPFEIGSPPWTTPVGYYDGNQTPSGTDMANGYGLYDMAGNVWEWCNDMFDDSYYSSSPTNNPTGPMSGTAHVCRGGSWGSSVDRCRVARRFSAYILGFMGDIHGFRIVLDLTD